MTLWHRAAGALAIAAIVLGLLQLGSEREGLSVSTLQVGSQPVTVFRPEGARQAPVVLVAHGFAGSQQLMQPLALALARAGFVAVTFDFPGHGRNALPMQGGIKEERRSLQALLGSMEEMRAFVLELSGGRPYAVLGHSMASDIIVRHAQAHPEVVATVAISLFGPSITATTPPDSPRNLLVIDGALEPAMMQAEALRVISRAAPAPALETAYGSMGNGTARKATLAPGVEHIGVLYSRHTVREAVLWQNQMAPSGPSQRI
jgi:alpha-beta hydrolase superfamily lysophospholipase